MTTCLKCGYERRASDTAPQEVCPQCGVIYAKARAALKRHLAEAESTPSKSKEKKPRPPLEFRNEQTIPRQKRNDEKFCHECGDIIKTKAEICPKCGVRQPDMEVQVSNDKFTGMRGEHKCLNCGYQGGMKTWLGHYNLPQFIAFLLLLCYVIPGLAFIAYYWNKNKCPKCGSIGKTINS